MQRCDAYVIFVPSHAGAVDATNRLTTVWPAVGPDVMIGRVYACAMLHTEEASQQSRDVGHFAVVVYPDSVATVCGCGT